MQIDFLFSVQRQKKDTRKFILIIVREFKPMPSKPNKLPLHQSLVVLGLGIGLILAIIYIVSSVYFAITAIVVIPPKFDYATPFKEGQAQVRLSQKWFYIESNELQNFKPQTKVKSELLDHNLQNVYPSQWYTSSKHSSINEGLLIIDNRKMCGYIDENYYEVIKVQFHDCQPSSEGLIGVKLNNKWGYIRNPLMYK